MRPNKWKKTVSKEEVEEYKRWCQLWSGAFVQGYIHELLKEECRTDKESAVKIGRALEIVFEKWGRRIQREKVGH